MLQDPLWCVYNLLSKVNRDLRIPYGLSIVSDHKDNWGPQIPWIISMVTDSMNKGGFTILFAFLKVPDHKDNKTPTISCEVNLNADWIEKRGCIILSVIRMVFNCRENETPTIPTLSLIERTIRVLVGFMNIQRFLLVKAQEFQKKELSLLDNLILWDVKPLMGP